MDKKLAELTVCKFDDYRNKVVEALENAGFGVVVVSDSYMEAHYIITERDEKNV